MIVDSNVVIDLLQDNDDAMALAALTCFAYHSARGPIFINHIIYAETAPRVADRRGFDGWLSDRKIGVVPFNADDAWRAGIAFQAYRRSGAPRESILPDFLIGGQAANRGWPLMTRDTKRFATYFPELVVIDPSKASHD